MGVESLEAPRTGPTASLPSSPFRVLALDGGGIRGYFSARLLERLVEQGGADPSRTDFGAAFRLIVGTSTGSLIGTALAAGLPLTQVSSLFRDRGARIFPRPAPTGWSNFWWCARHWRRPSADTGALRRELVSLFGTTTLGDLYARRGIALCLPATELRSAQARVLATPHRRAGAGTPALALVDACMASCAAPMLLPPLPVHGTAYEDDYLCDGGLWATSPVLVALAEALAIAPDDATIEILSVGTSAMPIPAAASDRSGRGIGFWIRGLRAVQATGDAQAHGAVDVARQIIPALRRPVRLVRLRECDPTREDAAAVRLDNASPAALAAMERLAMAAAALHRPDAGEPSADAACLDAIVRAAIEGGSCDRRNARTGPGA